MDGFRNSLLSSPCSHNNNTSKKIDCEYRLEPPAPIPNPEDYLVSAPFLENQEGIPNPEDYLVSAPFLENQEGTDPNLNGGDGCELANLPLPPVLLVNQGGTDPNLNGGDGCGSTKLPLTPVLLVNQGGTAPNLTGGDGCELTKLSLPSVAGSDLFSSNPTVLAPSSFMGDTQLFPGSHLFNQLPTSQAHETPVTATTYAGFDGMFLPRFRAPHGQATDPHSIAERHRREKISHRIKNLHDLIPNSNKTDKISMLDEINNYIKFLQLQINDLNGISSSLSVGSRAGVPPDGTTEMESKTKGLCLMPIELASAISTQKGKSTAVIPTARENSDPALNIASFFSNDGRRK